MRATLFLAAFAACSAAFTDAHTLESRLDTIQQQLNGVLQNQVHDFHHHHHGGGGGSFEEPAADVAAIPTEPVKIQTPAEHQLDAVMNSLARIDPIEKRLARIQDKVHDNLQMNLDKIMELRDHLNASTGIVNTGTTGIVRRMEDQLVQPPAEPPRPYHKVPLETALAKLQERMSISVQQIRDQMLGVRRDLNATFEAEAKFEAATLMDAKMLADMAGMSYYIQ
jgi:hypothetical protein